MRDHTTARLLTRRRSSSEGAPAPRGRGAFRTSGRRPGLRRRAGSPRTRRCPRGRRAPRPARSGSATARTSPPAYAAGRLGVGLAQLDVADLGGADRLGVEAAADQHQPRRGPGDHAVGGAERAAASAARRARPRRPPAPGARVVGEHRGQLAHPGRDLAGRTARRRGAAGRWREAVLAGPAQHGVVDQALRGEHVQPGEHLQRRPLEGVQQLAERRRAPGPRPRPRPGAPRATGVPSLQRGRAARPARRGRRPGWRWPGPRAATTRPSPAALRRRITRWLEQPVHRPAHPGHRLTAEG